eukprot:TRINITY_DN13108_c0_g2_i2.p1 TRINITY_DN13108_c0_g2~~TRINITY_DN13108_c0_g2_i2.p1  ORF type:complete len:490 (-),score=75.41 TRINITY_DN13108_c0_g2_i2:330-1799(-)
MGKIISKNSFKEEEVIVKDTASIQTQCDINTKCENNIDSSKVENMYSNEYNNIGDAQGDNDVGQKDEGVEKLDVGQEDEGVEKLHARDLSVVDLVIGPEVNRKNENERVILGQVDVQVDSFKFDILQPVSMAVINEKEQPQIDQEEKIPSKKHLKKSIKDVTPQLSEAYIEISKSLEARKLRTAGYRENISLWNFLDKGTLSHIFQLILNQKDAMSLMSCREVNTRWKSVIDEVIFSNSTIVEKDLSIEEFEVLIDSVDNPLNMIHLNNHTIRGGGQLIIDRDLIVCNGKFELHGYIIVEGCNIVMKNLQIQRQFYEDEIKQRSFSSNNQRTSVDFQRENQQLLFHSTVGGESWILHNIQILQNRFTGIYCTSSNKVEEYPLLSLSYCEFECHPSEAAFDYKCCLLYRCRTRFMDTVFEGRKAVVLKGSVNDQQTMIKLIQAERCNLDRVGLRFEHADGAYYTLVKGDAMGIICKSELPILRTPSQKGF